MYVRSFVFAIAFCASGAMVQAQDTMPADTATPLSRTVAWHGPQGDMLLRPSLLMPRADAHYAVFPMYVREDRYQTVIREGRVRISEAMPNIAVHGFGPGTDWTLVKLGHRHDVEVVRIASHGAWGDGFLSDEPFRADDIVPLTQNGAVDTYTLRPVTALAPGGYILCGKPGVDQGGWMRVCYDFEITGSGS